MRALSIDIETFSDVDLKKSGVYAYTASPRFQILLFGYAFDDEEVRVIDLAGGERLPGEVLEALRDDGVLKTAFNAQFERVCISRHLGEQLSPASWQCTAVQAASLGLPLSLDGVSTVLGIEEGKMKEGKDLIKFFSIPCKPTRVNGGRTRNLPEDEPKKWRTFKAYCKRDVEVERAIRKRLERYQISEGEQRLYVLDQEINDRGVLVDLELVEGAMKCDSLCREEALSTARRLTGLENPNSVSQLKGWLSDRGVKAQSLARAEVSELARESEGEVKEILRLRTELSKTSIKKYEAIGRGVCPDGRVRGLFQFYGANRTGRWAGRLVQVQNLPQNHLEELSLARELVKRCELSALEEKYESVPGVLSELIRTAFVPKPGHEFIVADFYAIEARVIAWLAGERWRMEVFKTHGKIYEASASQMFRVPIEEITKTSTLRQKGKIAELALGYGGSVGALKSMGALGLGLREEELPGLVSAWRGANQNIVRLWWDIDKAALRAVKERRPSTIGRIKIHYDAGILFITLPSGRRLSYLKPRIKVNKLSREGITFEGIGADKRWGRIETYGPKLVENIVQGIARDLLGEAMLRVNERGFGIVMHVHDEVVVEAKMAPGNVEEVCGLMAVTPRWAEGLPLGADGYGCGYYRKE